MDATIVSEEGGAEGGAAHVEGAQRAAVSADELDGARLELVDDAQSSKRRRKSLRR